jgi:hypothetical protein
MTHPVTGNDTPNDPRIDRLRSLTEAGYAALQRCYPKHEPLGCTLFAGRCFARPEPGILMLGLNPGLSDRDNCYMDLPDENWLLEGKPPKHLPYWRHARMAFGHARSEMDTATFSFCCPYRTRGWNLPVAHRRMLMQAAKPVLQQLMLDCAPRTVIVAGVETEAVFQATLGEVVLGTAISTSAQRSGRYQWRATEARWRAHSFVLLQIPHFSRANKTDRLNECGRWLAERLRQ